MIPAIQQPTARKGQSHSAEVTIKCQGTLLLPAVQCGQDAGSREHCWVGRSSGRSWLSLERCVDVSQGCGRGRNKALNCLICVVILRWRG